MIEYSHDCKEWVTPAEIGKRKEHLIDFRYTRYLYKDGSFKIVDLRPDEPKTRL